MKRLCITIFMLALLLTSCNFPLSKSLPQSDVVATRVAQTLAVLPSGTLTPTIGLPTVAQVTTNPTSTATETPTPTTPPDDPKLTLGSPTFTDTFTSGNAFGLKGTPYEDDAVIIQLVNGAMSFTSKIVNGGKRWRLTSPVPRNFYLEGTFKTYNCSEYDNSGLVMRSPDYSSGVGYYFGIACNGSYVFQKWTGSEPDNIIGWTSDSKINSGSNVTNRIGVMAKDNHFKLFINGNLITEFDDSSIPAKGHFGAYISAVADPGYKVDLREILEWNLP